MAKAKTPADAAAEAVDTAPAVAPVTPVVVADAPFMVRAIFGGTYPDPGSTLARWRNVGDAFLVKCQRDFSGRWMKRLSADEAAEVPVKAAVIPQTTAKPRKAPAIPLP